MFNPEAGESSEQANWHPSENEMGDGSLEKAEKEKRLELIRAELANVRDGLGEPIDPGIFETAIGLKANEINTTQSCEGHDDRGLALPWVDVGAPEPDNWKTDRAVQEHWTQENQDMTEKLRAILDEWIKKREAEKQPVDLDHALELHERGIYGAVRLESARQDELSQLDEHTRAKQAASHREIMKEFGEFLKSRFLG